MTQEELIVKVVNNEHELVTMKERLNKIEHQGELIQELLLSVQKLSISIEQMVKEQAMQGKRLEKLEKEPIERANETKKIIKTAVITVVVGAILGFVLGKVGF